MDRISAFLDLLMCIQSYCNSSPYSLILFKMNSLVLSFKTRLVEKAPFVFSLYIPFYLARVIFCLLRPQQCQPEYLKVNACKICIGEKNTCFVNFTSHTETVGSKFRREFQTNISGVSWWEQIRVVKDTRDINPGCYSMVLKQNTWLCMLHTNQRLCTIILELDSKALCLKANGL